AAYGRDQERDADRGGQLLAAKAGWNPMGMATFMQDLEAMDRLTTGWSRLPGFFDSHPSSPERAATASTRAQNLKWVPRKHIAGTHLEFLEKFNGLTLGDDPREGIFEETRFLHRDMDFSVRFPDGWRRVNEREVVGALDPGLKAFIALRIEGPGDDPQAMAKKVIETELLQARARVHSEMPVQVGNHPGYRLEVQIQSMQSSAIITFIAYKGNIYRIDTVARSGALKKYLGRGRAVARSFRPLTEKEKDLFEITQLKVVEAQGGENLAQLSARTENKLDLGTPAVLNDLFIDSRLSSAQPIKIGRGEPYVPVGDEVEPSNELDKKTSAPGS
ncbi:MAG: M48 family metalloprotease, partial [Myxococcota bacterium]